MSLALTSEEQLVADSIEGLLARRSPVSAFRVVRDSGRPERCDPALWSELLENGFALPQVPEALGGVGMGFVASGLVAQGIGRNLAATPFIASAIVASLLESTGAAGELKRLLGGAIYAFAHEEGLRHGGKASDCVVVNNGSSLRIEGAKRFVAVGALADRFVVDGRMDDQPCLLLVDAGAAGVSVSSQAMLDSANVAEVRFSAVELPAVALLARGDPAAQAIARALDIGRILLSAEMLGMAEEVFERTIAYLKEREQFGVKIGSFQALQHRASRLLIAVETARAVVLKALRALDGDEAGVPALASLAKAKLTEISRHVIHEGVQMHGGMGVTDELDIGLFLKRARVAGTMLGDDMYHRERLCEIAWRI